MELKHWASDLIGLLFPNLCNACGVPLFYAEKHICTKCLYDLPFTDYHLHPENRVAKQFWGRISFSNAMAMLYFRKAGKTQNLIHALKYHGKTDLGIYLGNLLAERLNLSSNYKEIDLIIPVPLHPKKKKIRGYNQSKFIAEGISQKLNIPFSETNLIRNVVTESQTKKTRYSRYENMKAVFSIYNADEIKGKHVLLVDDVITTGATLESCANILLSAGVTKISLASIAFTE